MSIAIGAEKLCHTYEEFEDGQTTTVFSQLDLTIAEGQFVVILGHNGCGKSTLAKHFNGVLLPTKGKVTVYGLDTLEDKSLWEIRRLVGMVFQNPDNQIVANVVEEDVAFAPENLGVDPVEIRTRVDEALAQVGMTDFAKHGPHLLSGGQKQRIAIAGVIAMLPRCIVLDEPTAMLDPQGRKEVLETIHRLNREHGITVILITHHMQEAIDADRVIVMEGGAVIGDGTPAHVFSQVELLRKAQLEVPETTSLLYELHLAGVEISLDNLSIEDCAQAIYQKFSQGGSTVFPEKPCPTKEIKD